MNSALSHTTCPVSLVQSLQALAKPQYWVPPSPTFSIDESLIAEGWIVAGTIMSQRPEGKSETGLHHNILRKLPALPSMKEILSQMCLGVCSATQALQPQPKLAAVQELGMAV